MLSHKGHKMCFVAFVKFLVTLVVENQMHGFSIKVMHLKKKALKYKLDKDLILNQQTLFKDFKRAKKWKKTSQYE